MKPPRNTFTCQPFPIEWLKVVPDQIRPRYNQAWIAMLTLDLYSELTRAINRVERLPLTMMVQTEFTPLRLNEKQKKAFVEWLAENEHDVFSLLDTVILSGHKLSITYDGQNDTNICAVTCKEKKSVNFNCCVTSRHETVFLALMLSLYKLTYVYADTSWRDVTSKEAWG